MDKYAIISVSDKTGVLPFAKALVERFGYTILSTGGTARFLQESGVPVTLVESHTGFPEMMDGRLKTLHPKIHGGILCDRDIASHVESAAKAGIALIDVIVVNLYPF